MIFSAHFLYKKIYANPNLYLNSNPSVFFLNPQYTFNEIQICTSANPMIFLLISFIYIYRQILICTLALTIIFKQIQKQHMNNILKNKKKKMWKEKVGRKKYEKTKCKSSKIKDKSKFKNILKGNKYHKLKIN